MECFLKINFNDHIGYLLHEYIMIDEQSLQYGSMWLQKDDLADYRRSVSSG